MWPLVVKGETRGEMVINPEEAAAIHAQLARMTSDELVGSLKSFFYSISVPGLQINKTFYIKMLIFFIYNFKHVFGVLKRTVSETVLLSTQNICFD